MKIYEITYLTVLEEGNDAKSIASFLGSHTAKIVSVHPWGNRRKLTHSIKKQDHAFFTTVVFEAEPSSIAGLQREIHLSNDVLRALIVEFEPGMFHRSSATDEGNKGKPAEKTVATEALVEIPAPKTTETQPTVAKEVAEKAEIVTDVQTETEAKPKKRRATKKTAAEDKSLDEKLDALLNEDITK